MDLLLGEAGACDICDLAAVGRPANRRVAELARRHASLGCPDIESQRKAAEATSPSARGGSLVNCVRSNVLPMQPERQALIGAAHLEAAVLDAIGDDTLTARQIRERLFPENEKGSIDLVQGILWRLCFSGHLEDDQDDHGTHYRYTRQPV